jgi:hypothetical protein
MLSHLARALIPATLMLACSHSVPTPALPTATLDSEYRTIQPDVSVSPTPSADAPPQPPPLDPNADVMAEILAIPPGR